MFKFIFRTIIMAVCVLVLYYLWKNPHLIGKFLKKDEITQENVDRSMRVLYDLISELNLSPENVEDDEFTWKVLEKEGEEVEDLVVRGKSLRLFNRSSDEQLKIQDYLETYGFVADAYNIAAGTVAGLVGFIKDDVVCVIESRVSGYDPLEEPISPEDLDMGKSDITVECGELE